MGEIGSSWRPAETRATGSAARYLFLQGPNGPFFTLLARRLSPSGVGIHRILINGGDSVYWQVPGAVTADYRRGEAEWPDFVRSRLSLWGITDLVVFGDCRPLHRAAIQLARLRGVRVHVFEEGYLRPHWVTLEADGVNRHSLLPQDPQWYLAEAADLPPAPEPKPVKARFAIRAAEDVLYTLGMVMQKFRFPAYRTHRPWHPLVEYAAGARRFFRAKSIRRKAADDIAQLLQGNQPYYLFPLQLCADAQIRFHSPFGGMSSAIRAVLASFAAQAPHDTRIVLTEHPLDTGVIDLRAATEAAAREFGIRERVLFVQGGSPDEVLRRARAVVTINSTIGIVALGMGRPVVALGSAIYAMPGLTHQGPLDTFWQGLTQPDPLLFDAFRRVVLHRTQINGSFHCPQGRQLAVEGAAIRLEAAAQTLPPLPASPISDIRLPQAVLTALPETGAASPHLKRSGSDA